MMFFLNVLFFIYLIMVLNFLIGWLKNSSQNDKSKFRLSVVIAVRNEEKKLLSLINSLQSRDYDKNLYDVIICLLYTSDAADD